MTSKPYAPSSPPPTDRPHQWVETADHLDRAIEEIGASSVIGIDTESDSFHHYREKVCLIQFSTKTADYLIDPLAVEDMTPIQPLFADPSREWVMNGADYDVVCLKRDFGIHFGRIFDTMIASQILGYEATGLAALLDRHFGVKVSKSFQKDEWFRRPLTPEQIKYAMTDTRYLIPLRGILRKELDEAGRLSWALEEFDLLKKREWTREPFSPDDFLKIKGAKRLSHREQIILRELAVMRDTRARRRDRPPFKIVSDAVLLSLARMKPRSANALRRTRGMSPLMVRRMGEEMLEAVRRGMAADEDTLVPPPKGPRRKPDPGAGKRLDALREWRKKKAVELGLDLGVLSPLSCLQAVARANPGTTAEVLKIPDITRWRARTFGAEWVEAISDS